MFWKASIPIIVVLIAMGFGSQFVKDYREMATTIAENRRAYDLLDSRYQSCQRMVERRNEAIAQSSCKAVIQDWIKHPEKLPSPVPQPFSQVP